MARRRTYRWASVCFSMFGTYLDPAEVTDTLGIRPDDSALVGRALVRKREEAAGTDPAFVAVAEGTVQPRAN
jgi:hypothetical protein